MPICDYCQQEKIINYYYHSSNHLICLDCYFRFADEKYKSLLDEFNPNNLKIRPNYLHRIQIVFNNSLIIHEFDNYNLLEKFIISTSPKKYYLRIKHLVDPNLILRNIPEFIANRIWNRMYRKNHELLVGQDIISVIRYVWSRKRFYPYQICRILGWM